MEKKQYVVNIGSEETIPCSLKNETKYIKWYDSIGQELNSTPGRIEISGSTLTLKKITLSDGGTYQCQGLTYMRAYTIYVTGGLSFLVYIQYLNDW